MHKVVYYLSDLGLEHGHFLRSSTQLHSRLHFALLQQLRLYTLPVVPRFRSLIEGILDSFHQATVVSNQFTEDVEVVICLCGVKLLNSVLQFAQLAQSAR